jgi:hypothetical protein
MRKASSSWQHSTVRVEVWKPYSVINSKGRRIARILTLSFDRMFCPVDSKVAAPQEVGDGTGKKFGIPCGVSTNAAKSGLGQKCLNQFLTVLALFWNNHDHLC